MSFPRYPAYKPSGVEWLGEVPDHWAVHRFKWEIERNDGGAWGDEPDGIDDIMVLRSTEQTIDGEWRLDDPAFRKLSRTERSSTLLKEGDLVVTKSSGSATHIGKTTIVHAELASMGCCYSNFMQRIRLQPSLHPRLAWYVMNNEVTRKQFDYLSNTTTGLANLNGTMISMAIVPVPTFGEQRLIVAFLDRETAKIDALITEQQRLIELLQEKRQAVISHAVTKGLNPGAPMKDSGVEWLGEVPEHWVVKAVRHCFEARNSLRTPIDLSTRALIEGEYPYYGPTGALSYIDRFVVEGEHFLIGEDGDHFLKYERLPMTLLVSGQFNVNNHAHLLRGKQGCLTQWGALFFEHRDLQPWLIKQGVGRYKLRKEKLMEIPVPVPPLAEQQEIIDFTVGLKSHSVGVVGACCRQIELLQERRSALISAAVTGQIDVRGLVPETSAA